MYSKLIDHLENKYFFNGWFDPVTLSQDSDRILLIELNINSAARDICDFFTVQLLNGDYIKLLNRKFDIQSTGLTEFLVKVSSQIELTNLDAEADLKILENLVFKIQNIFRIKIIDLLIKIIYPNFSIFLTDVKNQLEIDNNYKLSFSKMAPINGFDVSPIVNNIKIFKLAIKLLRVEHFEFKYQKEIVRKIHQISVEASKIHKEAEVHVAIILQIKAKVLFKKFIYRNNAEGNEGRTTGFIDTLENSNSEPITIENTKLPEEFKDWEEMILCQYEIDKNWKAKNAEFLKPINQKLDKSVFLSTTDIHTITKNYKDIHKDHSRLEQLMNSINFRESSNRKLLDRFSKILITNYVYNNYVSSFLENSEFSQSEIKYLVKVVNDKQLETSVQNFFPWQKIAQHVCFKLEKLSQRLFERETYSDFDDYLQLLNLTMVELRSTMEWSIEKNYLPFQNSYNNCFSKFVFSHPVVQTEEKLFFFTSYILPSNYIYYSNEFERLKSRQIKFETLKEVYKEISFVVDEVKANSQKVNNSERRSIEVLAIFSAVALFSIGSVQFFTVNGVSRDVNFFYNFLLSYGYSLALFSLVIWIITRENIRKVHYLHWIIVGILAVSSFKLIERFTARTYEVVDIENPNVIE